MSFSLFELLVDKELEIGSYTQSFMDVEKGIFLYRPPQRITPIYEIIQGAVRIGTYSPLGEEVCYDILQPGDFFGNLQYLNGQFSEFAKTLTGVRLRQYDAEFFKHACTHIPEASEWFSRQLVRRWCRAEERLFAVRSLDTGEKVRRILSQFQGQLIDAKGKRYSLTQLLTLQDIADLSGMTRQTASKAVKELLYPTKPKRKTVKS